MKNNYNEQSNISVDGHCLIKDADTGEILLDKHNAINFQIQSLAAGIVNRAAIAINRKAKELGIDAYVEGQVHDQLIINVKEEEAETFKPVAQEIMENIFQLEGVTLKAPPEIAENWSEGH